MSSYTRRRANWLDWPSMSTPVQAADYNQWDQAIYELKTGPSINVTDSEWGAVGDGVTDDTTPFVNALATGKHVTAPPGKTFLISSGLTCSSTGQILDLRGSTIKKKSTMTQDAITVSGSSVTVRNVTIDGNRAAGATGHGLVVTGAGCLAVDVTSTNQKGFGFAVTTSPGVLTAVRCAASNNDGGSGNAGNGDGFYAQSGGVLKLFNCSSSSNVRSGVLLAATAGDRCHIDGLFELNGNQGVWVQSSNGTMGVVRAERNAFGGVYLDGATGWQVDALLIKESGSASAVGTTFQPTANGLQLVNSANENYVGSLLCKAIPGYGLALSSGSSLNTFGTVSTTAHNGGNANPGVVFTANAAHNTLGTVTCYLHTLAVNFGEGATTGNDNNVIDTLFAIECHYGALRSSYGNHNHIGRIISRNCYTADVNFPGLVYFDNAVTGNTVRFIDHKTESGTKPTYILYVKSDAGTGNEIREFRDRGDFATAQYSINTSADSRNRYGTAITARVYRTALQTITSGLETAINFDNERWDTDGIHDNVTNPTRLTCQTAGTYLITGTLAFAANSTGVRTADIKLNGTTFIGETQIGGASEGITLTATTIYPLAVGDYVELYAFQDSGGSLNVTVAGAITPEFSMIKIA